MNESDRELSFVKSKMYQQSASLSSAAAFLLCLGNSMALFGGDTGIEHQTQSLSSLYSLNHVYQIYVQQNRLLAVSSHTITEQVTSVYELF